MQAELSEILRHFRVSQFNSADYINFKREVARAIQPRSILEIGIGMGVAALAFLEASPFGATYTGIDNDYEYEKKFSVRPTDYVRDLLGNAGYHTDIVVADSSALTELPARWYDLAHIDGDHREPAVRHDVTLAWQAGSKWILCDDARDTEVVRGIFNALHDLNRGSVDWAYFPQGSGNILIRTDHKRGEL